MAMTIFMGSIPANGPALRVQGSGDLHKASLQKIQPLQAMPWAGNQTACQVPATGLKALITNVFLRISGAWRKIAGNRIKKAGKLCLFIDRCG
jgi:hypothetical protein